MKAGGLEYYVYDNGTVEIADYDGDDTVLQIPDKFEGKSVTSINRFAFYNCSSLESVIVPNSVTNIGESAFYGCSNLTSITLSKNLTSIGNSMFYECSSLESVVIPDSVISIGSHAFYNCSGLTSITLSKNLTSIEFAAFASCRSLTSVTIPESVIDIDKIAFSGCPQTMVIYTTKGSYAEQWAKANGYTVQLLDANTPQPPNIPNTSDKEQTDGTGTQPTLPVVGTKKTVSNGVYKVTKSSATSKEVTFTKPKNSKKTSVTIPATIKIDGQTYKVTEIAPKAFKSNKKLKSVTIGKNVKTIGKEAFSGCSKLNKIVIQSTVVKTVGKNAIKGINVKATIKCPKKQLSAYKKLFKSKTGYKKSMKIKK